MNNSFEQFFNKIHHSKQIQNKNVSNQFTYFKKQPKNHPNSKSKNMNTSNHSKYPSQLYNYSVMSNSSMQKNINKINNTRSNKKRSKRQESTSKKPKQTQSIIKKSQTIQLTKKQKQIRQAIQYRYEKSKMKNYLFHLTKQDQIQDLKVRQIIDSQEEEYFVQNFGYLADFKLVNLYQYQYFKEEINAQKEPVSQPVKDKPSQKIIVIKNPKKKRQNSDLSINLHHQNQGQYKWTKNANMKLFLNSNNNHYFNHNNQIQSQRYHTQTSSSHHQRIKSGSPGQQFKLQFPSSKAFHKQKSGSRSKIKTQNSVGVQQKILNSSSVQKNFKSIKDIYLNAITNLVNKNTVKTNNKLFKNQSQLRNKGSKSVLYESQKKGHRNEYHSTRPQKNNSSSVLHQNYFSCISSRQNKKQQKSSLNENRKPTKQKLDKTLLMNEVNPSQWKSIIMKVQDTYKSQNKEQKQFNDKKFKLKLKDHGFEKINKNGFNSVHGKFMLHPNSYRQNTKSPKYKRFIVNDDQEKDFTAKTQNKKNAGSIKNINNHSYQNLLNQSGYIINQQIQNHKKTKK